jgi:hypothetical protein
VICKQHGSDNSSRGNNNVFVKNRNDGVRKGVEEIAFVVFVLEWVNDLSGWCGRAWWVYAIGNVVFCVLFGGNGWCKHYVYATPIHTQHLRTFVRK